MLEGLCATRRSKGRKVSPRWLSATGRRLLNTTNPGMQFVGGRHWRARWAKRFNHSVRRKTNCKAKTFATSEPALLRYFTGLRMRCQVDQMPQPWQHQAYNEVEPEPEDNNPEAEEAPRGGEHAFDEEDEADSDDELLALKDIMPVGMEVAAASPTEEQLEFRIVQGLELVGQCVAVNWAGVGWVMGEIASANSDGRLRGLGRAGR